jgi:hypothetical protein
MSGQLAMAEVATQLADRMPDLTRSLCGEPTQRGQKAWRWRRKGSLAVEVAGPQRGHWYDHEAGRGGDALALVAHLQGTSMRLARDWALRWLGEAIEGVVHSISAGTGGSIAHRSGHRWPAVVSPTAQLAQDLWGASVPGADTPVAAYLAGRGLALPVDAPLRFHPHAWRNPACGPASPAMLALMSHPLTGRPCGTHVTYLHPSGTRKADGERPKIMLGRAGVIRLVPDTEVTLGLGLAEGIETALAVMQRCSWYPVWAASSAGAIARFPVLTGIEALTVFADADGPGLDAAHSCCRVWAEAGREARLVAPPAGDWDDALPHRRAA